MADDGAADKQVFRIVIAGPSGTSRQIEVPMSAMEEVLAQCINYGSDIREVYAAHEIPKDTPSPPEFIRDLTAIEQRFQAVQASIGIDLTGLLSTAMRAAVAGEGDELEDADESPDHDDTSTDTTQNT